jgi:hypothetical protein
MGLHGLYRDSLTFFITIYVAIYLFEAVFLRVCFRTTGSAFFLLYRHVIVVISCCRICTKDLLIVDSYRSGCHCCESLYAVYSYFIFIMS